MAYIGSPAAPTIATVSDDTITSAKLADDAVTSAKLDTNIAVDGNLTVDTNTLYVDSTNNRVGIGTSSPDFDLEVYKTTTAEVAIGSDNGGTAQLSFYENNSTTKEFYVKYDGTGNNGVIGTSGASNAIVIPRDTGNVGIGTSSPTYPLTVNEGANVNFGVTTYTAGEVRLVSEHIGAGNAFTTFYTSASGTEAERMRISGDYVMIGTTSPILSSSAAGVTFQKNSEQGYIGIGTTRSAGTDMQRFITSGGIVGTISANSSNTNYGTTSDYRLKENVVEVTDGISRVKLLKPSRFNFIVDPDKTVDGFLAHEVSDVVPEAIFGDKDGTDDEGNPKYQQIDQSKLVPLLTAALQEAIAKIESLEARVATLESA